MSLVRDDGEVLARFPRTETQRVGAEASMLRHGHDVPEGAVLIRSSIDGAELLAAYQRIDPYPVFVTFAVGLRSVLAPWRRDLLAYGLVAVLASAVLLFASAAARNLAVPRHCRWFEADKTNVVSGESERLLQSLGSWRG